MLESLKTLKLLVPLLSTLLTLGLEGCVLVRSLAVMLGQQIG